MFRFEFRTLTQIGEVFGASSHQVGKWLVEIGLLTEGKRPSTAAFDGEFVTQGPSRGNGYNWVWHSVRTVAALEKAGHRRIPESTALLGRSTEAERPVYDEGQSDERLRHRECRWISRHRSERAKERGVGCPTTESCRKARVSGKGDGMMATSSP